MATWTVHAFLLTAYGPQTVYVGVSWHRPAVRLDQHLQGYKSSRQVRYGKPELAEDLYDHLRPFWSRNVADDAADELAVELTAAGYDVKCDPHRLARIHHRAAAPLASVSIAAGKADTLTASGEMVSHEHAA